MLAFTFDNFTQNRHLIGSFLSSEMGQVWCRKAHEDINFYLDPVRPFGCIKAKYRDRMLRYTLVLPCNNVTAEEMLGGFTHSPTEKGWGVIFNRKQSISHGFLQKLVVFLLLQTQWKSARTRGEGERERARERGKESTMAIKKNGISPPLDYRPICPSLSVGGQGFYRS